MSAIDPSDAVQLAVRAALMGSADVAAAFGANTVAVWDRVPIDGAGLIDTAAFPYFTIGEDQVVGHDANLGEISDVHVQVEAWSRSTSRHEVKTLAGAARKALGQVLAVTGFNVATWRYEGTMYRREADGLTDRAIVKFRYQTSPLSS